MTEATSANDYDFPPVTKSGSRRSKLEPLSAEMRVKIKDEAERTGASGVRLLRGASDKPHGLNSATINSWLSGKVQSANPIHVKYVLARWAAMPNNRRIPFTSEMSAALMSEFIRTNTGPVPILKRARDIPFGLTHTIIRAWQLHEVDTVSETHWDYVTKRLHAMPDVSPFARQSSLIARMARDEINPHDLAELRGYCEQSGVGGGVLLREATDKPPGLTPAMISSWLNGVAKTALPEHVAYVLARYRARSKKARQKIEASDLAELRAHRQRLGFGGAVLLRNATDKPEGLTPFLISKWLSGEVDMAKSEHVAYVLARYRSWPSVSFFQQPTSANGEGLAEIEVGDRAELRHHRKRTGIGGAVLLRAAADKPAGLKPGMISGWLTGATIMAKPGYVAYVLARYRAWP